MPFYRYEAVDRSGKSVMGTMDAPGEPEVYARLAQMGYSPCTVTAAPGNGARSGSTSARAITAQPLPAGAPASASSNLPKAGAKDMALFFRQFAALVRSGISLYLALEHL